MVFFVFVFLYRVVSGRKFISIYQTVFMVPPLRFFCQCRTM
ncbi:unnamed protein product [Amoebophrya sp. A25]|nr:unnamed protein product [Amoebophrya sp. A25]|eukprot:GSA25T00016188001.1